MENPKKNSEGYADPTAYHGTRNIVKKETESEKKAAELIRILKYIIRNADFELIDRIRIKDKNTGKEYR